MASGETQYLFKETRLNLEPPSPASIASIRVPSKASGSRSQQKLLAHDASTEDETTFRLRNLASASSVFHRKSHDTPRSFLWRVLEDGHVLNIRAVDICKKDKAPDAPLVLNFTFSVPIQPGCVAFADPEEHDALCVFVLDQASQLYTFTLRPDLFRKRTAVDASLGELGKVQPSTGLGFKHPHRLVAVSTNVLLVTVNDGGIIRFDRAKSNDTSGVLWKETFFNVQGWTQNLRSLLPFQGKHTIKYGKVNMEYSAATSIQISSLGLSDGLFAVTVCLDHRMRIWNVEDGQILYTGDILNVERSPQEVGKWSIDPSQSNLVQILGKTRGQRICVTYSPVGPGEFKFWRIIAKEPHTVVVEDMFPRNTLLPPAPSSSDIWTLTDFIVSSPAEGSINLWTLWKNNMTYRVQHLDLDRREVEYSWENSWEAVYCDTSPAAVQASGPCDPTDVTEKWLQAILRPGRFTKATLETALAIYERGLGSARDNSRGRSLAESICSVLGSTASLERGPSGSMDYEQFRASNETQWRRFYRLLNELDRQRGEALGLALDPESNMTWVVCTDLLSAITDCNSLERLCHNLSKPEEDQEQAAALISCALSFTEGLADTYQQMCRAALRQEVFEESTKTDLERIQYLSDKAGFWRGITDEDCVQVVDALGPNFGVVTDDLYRSVLDLIAAPVNAKRRQLRHPLTEFGKKLIMKGVQDCIDLQWKFCFSQLILLVHMEFEFDSDEEALHHRVDVGRVFRDLIDALRRLELIQWLAKTELSVPFSRSEKGTPSVGSKKGAEETQVVTALEANVGHLLGVTNTRTEPLSETLSHLVTNLCAPDSDVEVSPTLIQCSLVRRERADLALDLAPFCDQNPFSVYIQGRVLLVLKNFEAAATNFRKAAIGMGTGNVKSDRHSCGLLDDTEWNLLNSGQGRYYSHIVALFEEQRAYSYVLTFARLAMQFLGFVKSGAAGIKTDMLSRLFHAALVTSQFELAHTTLLSFKDDALRQSSLRMLVDKMCESYHSTELVSFSFPGMQQEVDAILAQRCKSAMDVMNGFPYHQVLYSWRIKRNNYRGAASVLMDRIQKLRYAGEGDNMTGEDVLDTPVTRQYLMLINALSCVDPKQAWVFDEGIPGVGGKGSVMSKRKVVSLADIRKQYQDELDRIAAIQNNQFGFEADDVMEIA
ncbi:hypothetical protein HIM_07962 [Hirsutella minnesotensis 3608]|uniref:Nucleoporin Nup120/160 n=1 Tax=Hirsutella minnesotensis 3608 TaxID=1043627 RepID=A0A0F7ZT71_9HYPO|nr:hypothetical protein HIM_07962 [Hirsutella minnesotensis 3608]